MAIRLSMAMISVDSNTKRQRLRAARLRERAPLPRAPTWTVLGRQTAVAGRVPVLGAPVWLLGPKASGNLCNLTKVLVPAAVAHTGRFTMLAAIMAAWTVDECPHLAARTMPTHHRRRCCCYILDGAEPWAQEG